MATETTAVPTNSPASKSNSLTNAFRSGIKEAASSDSKVAAVVAKIEGKPAPEKPAETKPAETPPVETKPAETTLKGDPDAGLKPPAAQNDKETNLANLRKKAEDLEKAKSDIEAKYRDLEARFPKDYDQIKKDREDLERALEEVNVERSPRFQEKYNKPQQQQLDAIRKTLAVTDVNADSFVALVQMPESRERHNKLSEAFGALDEISKGKIASAVSAYDQLREQRAAELVNPSQTFQEIQREAQQRTQAQKQQHEKVIEDVIKTAESKIPWFKPIDGNDAWNQAIDDVRAQSRRLWTQATSPQELAEVTFLGALTPKVFKALELSHAENARLNEELAQYRDATPKNGAGKSGTGETAAKGEWKKGDGIKAFFSGAGVK